MVKIILLAYSRALVTVLAVWIFKTELSKITGKNEYDQERPQSHGRPTHDTVRKRHRPLTV